MRYKTFGVLAVALSFLTSCNSHRNKDVIAESYVHKYGVEVPKENWASSGQSGQVVTTLKNGVTVTKNYVTGELEGETFYTFPHSNLIHKKEIFSKGILQKEIENYRSGQRYCEKVILSPTVQDISYWYENGTLQAKERLENALVVDGEYYNEKNQVIASVKNGQGNRVERDQYGVIVSDNKLKDGQAVQRTIFHSNGAPKDVTCYASGVVAGERRTYMPAGEPNTIEQWENGVQHGLTVIFENGERFAEIPYVNGKKSGVERRFRDGDEISEEITWLNDQRQGPTNIYVGDAVKTDWYHQDKHVSKNMYDHLNKYSASNGG